MDGGATEIVGGGPVTDLGGLERWWNDPGIAVWTFVIFGCFLLNATLLLAFLIRPGLRTISNRFVMNLTVSNLLTCAILNPLLIMDGPSTSTTASMPTSSSTAGICTISEGATALVTTSSVFSVLLIALDQYFAVVDPLRYRSRVDKFKSGILIVSVWLVSAIFAFLASFNPNPRGVWLSCVIQESSYDVENGTSNSSLSVNRVNSTLALIENGTSDLVSKISRSFEVAIDGTIESMSNSTGETFETLPSEYVTYGLVYAIVHSVFAYFLPFAGVCWIYVSIYAAAHRNSERTRRTGSRPVLSSSASFCEDHYTVRQQLHQDVIAEDFRRIPKISSLSSIDETSETTQPSIQPPRRRSLSASSDALHSTSNDQLSSGVIFTVGSQRIQVSPPPHDIERDEDRNDRISVATLKAEFLEKDTGEHSTYEDLVRSKFLDRPDHRRKSSHDLMYEEMLARANAHATWDQDSSEDSSDSEAEAHSEDFNALELSGASTRNYPQIDNVHLSPFSNCSMRNSMRFTMASGEKHSRSNKEVKYPVDSDCETAENVSCLKSEDRMRSSDNLTTQYPSVGKNNLLSPPCTVDVIVNAPNSNSSPDETRYNRRDTSSNCVTEPSTCLLTPIVTITPAPNKNGTLQRVASIRSTSSYINSLKHRISNGSLFRYREETRAARISALVIVMGLICWSPYVILLVLKNLPRYSDQDVPHEYDVLALSFLILAAYVSPLLFGYRSRRVKRELRKFFCFKRELSYKNNRSLMAKKVLKRRHSSTLSHLDMDHKYNIFNCVYGRSRWPKEKVQFVQVPDTALVVETCRSSFSSGASTQISSTSTDDC